MKKKTILTFLTLLMPLLASAQWRVGVTAGAAYNHYSIDKQYWLDYQYEGAWSPTIGVTGQYDFNSWFGVRADLSWTQKNHREYRRRLKNVDYKVKNHYLLLPVMASFNFGGQKLRGFCNLGVYGGYWLSSHIDGVMTGYMDGIAYPLDTKVEFMSERDKRWDCGLVGGLGLEYRFDRHWIMQAEARCYYSTTSTVKDYQQKRQTRYNTTIGLQAGVAYCF